MALSIIRISALALLSIVAFLCIFSETSDSSALLALVLSKAIGFAAAYAVYRLYSKWSKSDPLIKRIEKL